MLKKTALIIVSIGVLFVTLLSLVLMNKVPYADISQRTSLTRAPQGRGDNTPLLPHETQQQQQSHGYDGYATPGPGGKSPDRCKNDNVEETETTDWSVYRDPEGRFSLCYSPYLTLKPSEENRGEVSFYDMRQTFEPKPPILLLRYITVNSPKTALSDEQILNATALASINYTPNAVRIIGYVDDNTCWQVEIPDLLPYHCYVLNKASRAAILDFQTGSADDVGSGIVREMITSIGW